MTALKQAAGSRQRAVRPIRACSRRSKVARIAIAAVFTAAGISVTISASRQRFYSDDPITQVPETQDASGVAPWDIGLMYEIATNLFVTSRYKPSGIRAQNINTIDEVPDSSWFTNRIGSRPVTVEDITRGPVDGPAPEPERWLIMREKSAGVSPGFTVKDGKGNTWFLAFDKPEYPEGGSGAVVVASKLFWALGYNQVQMFVSTFDPNRVVIDPTATKKRPSGSRTPFTRNDLGEVLDHAARNADGTYRVAAGALVPGKILGGFRYAGTRPDDPNDIVPHEHRRELRALRVFGAWTNLTDLKAGNTLDTLVKVNGRAIVKHVLQDVGSTFGMANGPYEWDIGWEHFYEGNASLRRLLSFGFALSPWQTVPYVEYPSIGKFEGDRFDPRTWKPQTPTTAYMELRADDAFWAARRVMAFSDELIRAAVHTGQYSDPAAANHLAAVLIKRRDVIGRTYLPAINPIVDPRLDPAGVLTFANAAVTAGFAEAPSEYHATWSVFNNVTGETEQLGQTRGPGTTMTPPHSLPPALGSYIEIDISAESATHATWREPIRTFYRRTSEGWKLVGLERLPERIAAAPERVAEKD